MSVPHHRLLELKARPGNLSTSEIADLHRLLRDPERSIWTAACAVAGDRATTEPTVHAELRELLASPLEELRLRGVAALGAYRGEEALEFLRARLADTADPVVLHAVVTSLARHPAGTGVLLRALEHRRDEVREALAASLPSWTGWPEETLVRLARDPSPRVRVALAGTLPQVDATPALGAARWALACDADPLVRQAVAEDLPRGDASAQPLLEILAADTDPLVRAAARESLAEPRPLPPEPPARPEDPAVAWEQALDAEPSSAFDSLRRLLDQPDAPQLLEGISRIARDRWMADLCRVLHRLHDLPPAEAHDRLLEAVGVLEDREEPLAVSLRIFLIDCVEAVDVLVSAELAVWGSRIDPAIGGQLSEVAEAGLARLQAASSLLAGGGEVPAALSLLDQLRRDLDGAPAPERCVLGAIVEAWTDVLEAEIYGTFAGLRR